MTKHVDDPASVTSPKLGTALLCVRRHAESAASPNLVQRYIIQNSTPACPSRLLPYFAQSLAQIRHCLILWSKSRHSQPTATR